MSATKIALRNLSRQKRRTFLLGGAIAFGVLVVTLVNGATGGLILNIEANVSKVVAGHLIVSTVSRDENKRVVMAMNESPDLDRLVAELPVPVAYQQKRTQFSATLIYDSTSIGRTIEGVDWQADQFLLKDLVLSEGNLADLAAGNALLISRKQADKLGAGVGDGVLVQVSTVRGQQNVQEFRVRGIYDDTGTTVSASAYLDRESANRLIDLPPGSFNVLGVTLERFSDTDQAAAAFRQGLGEVFPLRPAAEVWGKTFNQQYSEFNKDKTNRGPLTILSDVNTELAGIKGNILAVNAIALGVLVLLLLVVMVGLTNTYRIIVFERTREIGTMRAMGMQRPVVQRIFVLEAVFLSLGGVLAGILLAVLVLSGLSLIDFGGSSNTALAMILNSGHMAWRLDPFTLVATTLLVAFMTWLAALLPARRAGRVDPAVALRTTA